VVGLTVLTDRKTDRQAVEKVEKYMSTNQLALTALKYRGGQAVSTAAAKRQPSTLKEY